MYICLKNKKQLILISETVQSLIISILILNIALISLTNGFLVILPSIQKQSVVNKTILIVLRIRYLLYIMIIQTDIQIILQNMSQVQKSVTPLDRYVVGVGNFSASVDFSYCNTMNLSLSPLILNIFHKIKICNSMQK